MSMRNSIEKPQEAMHVEAAAHVVEIDNFRVLGLSPEDVDFYTNYGEDRKKKTFRKVSIFMKNY